MIDPGVENCKQTLSQNKSNFSRAICLSHANHSLADVINHFKKNPSHKKNLPPHIAAKIDHPHSMAEHEVHIARAAFLKKNIWPVGHTIRICFLNGTDDNKAWVQKVINGNFMGKMADKAKIKLNLDWDVPPEDSDIRIYFDPALLRGEMGDSGSWSLIGTEVLDLKYDPSKDMSNPPNATIHYSWLDQTEANTGSSPGPPDFASAVGTGAVVIHEFGHALGMIHEHQRSDVPIQWNKPMVNCYFGGPPNDWDSQTIEENVYQTYDMSTLNASQYDPKSIMEYYYPPSLFISGPKLAYNTVLSSLDKEWLEKVYPGGAGKIMGNVIIKDGEGGGFHITYLMVIIVVVVVVLLLVL